MLFEWINNRYGIFGLYLFLLGSGLTLYFILSSISYLYFFYFKRNQYHPQYQYDKKEILKSIKWAFFSAAGNSAFVVIIEVLIIYGNSKIYYDFNDYSWSYTVFSILMVLLIAETLIYWIHRGLHSKLIYRYFHIYHHQFREPTPFASVAFHPIDSFFQASPYHLCAFLLPLNIWVYHGFVILATIWAVIIHDRVRLIPCEWVNHTGCHMVHHWYFAHNYGQYFTFWDRLCGTYKSPECLPEKFYSSWPRQAQQKKAPA